MKTGRSKIKKLAHIRIISESSPVLCDQCGSSLDYDGCLLPTCDNYYKKKGFEVIAGNTVHKTKLKCIVNPILRKLQWFTNKPYVIASKTSKDNGHYLFEGYTFRRVRYE